MGSNVDRRTGDWEKQRIVELLEHQSNQRGCRNELKSTEMMQIGNVNTPSMGGPSKQWLSLEACYIADKRPYKTIWYGHHESLRLGKIVSG